MTRLRHNHCSAFLRGIQSKRDFFTEEVSRGTGPYRSTSTVHMEKSPRPTSANLASELDKMAELYKTLVRKLVLWVAVGCTLFGIVSLFLPDPAGSLLYLVGFPLLCVMLFAF